VAEYYSEYKQCFEGAGTNPGEKTLEDKFFEYEVLVGSATFWCGSGSPNPYL
jgi:V-type H+-transporting ATPase subunit d